MTTKASNKAADLLAKVKAAQDSKVAETPEAPKQIVSPTAEIKVPVAPPNPMALNTMQMAVNKPRIKFYSKMPGLNLILDSKKYIFKSDVYSSINDDEIATLRAFAALNPEVIYEIK